MSRETMRQVLTATLAEVGVAAPRGATAENLVAMAAERLLRQAQDVAGYQRRERQRQAYLREALRRVGHDPGAHALVDDMIAELVAAAEGRLVR